MNFKQFLKTKGAIGAIFMGVFYAVMLLTIFLPGYKALPANMSELKIALVNDDQGEIGSQIAAQLRENLSFKTIDTDLSNKEALKALEKNEYALVIHIPENFSADAQSGNGTSIDFTVNEAGPSSVSSLMQSVVANINNQFSTTFSQQTAQNILLQLNVPEQQAADLATKIENAYTGNYIIMNDIPAGMDNTMLPMFLTTAAYVGSMIAAIQLVGLFRKHRTEVSRVRLFIYVQATALLIGVLAMTAEVTISYIITDVNPGVLWKVALQQVLLYMASFNVCAIPIFLLGESGSILNIPILLIQTIANGSSIPRDMMYWPYELISYITPMYYSVQAYFATMFGSTSPAPHILGLVGVLASENVIKIQKKKKKKKKVKSA